MRALLSWVFRPVGLFQYKRPFRKILAIDFDGTINSYLSGWMGPRFINDPPVDGALDFMANALDADYDVVIVSTRAAYWGGKRAMRRWLRHHAGDRWRDYGDIPGLWRVRYTSLRPPAILTIDDRAMKFEGVWPSIETVNGFTTWQTVKRQRK